MYSYTCFIVFFLENNYYVPVHIVGFFFCQVSMAGPLSPPTSQLSGPSLPKGRWAQTAGEQLVMKSMLDETSIQINLNNLGETLLRPVTVTESGMGKRVKKWMW